MDTSNGTVHMIIGGGGHSTPTPVAGFDMPHDGVLITSVGPGSPHSQHPLGSPTYAPLDQFVMRKRLSSQVGRNQHASRLAGATATS